MGARGFRRTRSWPRPGPMCARCGLPMGLTKFTWNRLPNMNWESGRTHRNDPLPNSLQAVRVSRQERQMPPLILSSLDALKELVGREIGCSEWFVVTQDRIQRFAEVTEDQQSIHLDRERPDPESPYGTTI